ncbi:uncharacterized protein LOC123879393 isoform X2 [Maniola jurtina]|nr:uncharacterized protein LOC123879393 isoform X2 [Maniola jurtina]XP_045783015.1 uncharacterized protein LOC123879393 isoform X2 [Maniola jurtina]XP_045783016.1 uncharacterized protein LOC123879393 isoform X2 [Maniola jurtina]
MASCVEEVAADKVDIPEIYIDESILKPIVLDCVTDCKKPLIYDKVYEINGTIFREDGLEDSDTLSLFEIQTTDTGDGEMEVTIHDTTDIYLPVSIQETPYGLIINSNMLLTVAQWNTLVEQGDTHKCIVCDTKIGGTTEHIDSDIHLRNLEKYQPLKKFDLNITRLIKDFYHCGVCNECFGKDAENEHFDSKTHEDKMLFATNRASDVLYDFDLHVDRNSDQGSADNGNKNNDCYHFNRNRILSLSDTSGFDSAEGFYDYDYDDNAPYVSEYENDINDNVFSSNDIDFNVTENNEYNEPNYVSYASIAKKVAATPDYLYVTIFDKRMKMKFDHWHMISMFKSNQLYCMVCKKYYQVTVKAQHCAEKTHLDKLKCYKFVEEYKSYFIRKIDLKYYHCGICNNIQLADEIKSHIEAKHKKKVIPALLSEVVPKRNKNNDNSAKNRNTGNEKTTTLPLFKEPQIIKNTDKTPQVKNTSNVIQTVMNTRNESNENLPTRNTVTENQAVTSITSTNNVINENNDIKTVTATNNDSEREINNESPNIHNDVILNQNGFRIRVSFMSYNFVTKTANEYHCHICNVTANETDVSNHMKHQDHIGMLRNVTFQDNYGIHLIRMIGFQDHCTVCNALFNMEHTKLHLFDSNHIKKLTKALATQNYQNKPYCDLFNQPKNNLNQTAIRQLTMPRPATHQTSMHQPATHQPATHQPATHQPAMHQPAIHQPAIHQSAMHQPAMHQPAMSMNQSLLGLNQPPVTPPLMGMQQWPMNQPRIGMNQPIFPPTLGLARWPIPLPTFGMHVGPSGVDLNQRATSQIKIHTNQLITNMNQRKTNQTKLDMNQTKINQHTTSIPNLDTNQSKTDMNQNTTIQFNSKDIETELKTDTNQSKKIESQRATNQYKSEDETESKTDTNQSKKIENQRATNQYKSEDETESKTDTNQSKKIESQRARNQYKLEDNKRTELQIDSIQDMIDLNESLEDVEDDFEYFNERFVYLKFKNTYVQVALASYNSLIKIGDGTTYCFVCSVRVYGSMKKHIESKNHAKCMDGCKFVAKYDRHLLRQMFLNYHCSVCNIIFTRKDINKHITWPLHLQDNKTDKKARKRDLKSGRQLLNISFQNENIYLNEKESEIKILVIIEISASCQSEEILQKKNKIIIFGGKVLRISWDAYHGFCKNKSGHRCVLCQRDVRSYEFTAHIAGAYHKGLLDAFETSYLPDLIRKIDESTLNCVICNVEVPNKEHVVADHVCAKKHKKNYSAILLDSCTVGSYADCNEDVLNLSS